MEPNDEHFMRQALLEARVARAEGEVPVGAVVVLDGEIIGRGHNSVIGDNDPTAHAEMVALREAATRVGNYRLVGARMYSTIEPCAMCAGAVVHARVARLVYGARDPKSGAVESHFGICSSESVNHRPSVDGGILEDDCKAVLQSFFRERRGTE